MVADLGLGLPTLPGKLPIADLTLSWRDPKGRTLDDRIWSNRQGARDAIDRIIRDGIRNNSTIDDVASELISYIRPSYAPYGGGRAQYAANRLANNEMRRAHSLAERQASMTDPDAGFMRFRTAPSHIDDDECTDHANHDQGLGKGVWPAQRCPLPPIHVGCRCGVSAVPYSEIEGRAAAGMDEFVEQLRADYGLADPPDLSPAELAVFRRETAQVRQDVQLMFQGWFEQTGLVSREQLLDSSPTVSDWVQSVRAAKQRRRGR